MAGSFKENFFVAHPRFASVVSIVITLVGLICFSVIPVAQFPDIVAPSVRVSAYYPGASAATIDTTVAQLIESSVNGVENMTYMKSTSSASGNYSLTVTFRLGTDPNMNMVNVQNRIAKVQRSLPDDVVRMGVTVSASNSSMLMALSFYSPKQTYDELFIGNYVKMNILDPLSRVDGVGDLQSFSLNYSLRVWLDVRRMQTLDITPDEVVRALAGQNLQASLGKIGARPAPATQEMQYNIDTQGRLVTVEEFGNVVVRVNPKDGRFLRVRDLGTVEIGPERLDATSRYNGYPASGFMISQRAGSNAVKVAENVNAKLAELAERFPEDFTYSVVYDATKFVDSSIAEVEETLVIAFILVIISVYIFLGTWRATLIPMMTVPVSLIGTFIFLEAIGHSMNTISMFALVLAIGVVVDDAIVVVENVERLMEEEVLDPVTATTKSMREISMPIVAITLVVLSVFVPVAFMPGTTGRLFQEFGITISVSIFISAVCALTLSPAMCAIFLTKEKKMGIVARATTSVVEKLKGGYGSLVSYAVRGFWLAVFAVLGLGFALFTLFKTTPTAFLPTEDQGMFMTMVQLPEGAAANRTLDVVQQVEKTLLGIKGVRSTMAILGYSILNGAPAANSATVITGLDDYGKRLGDGITIDKVIGQAARGFASIGGDAMIRPMQLPPIIGVGSVGGFEYQLEDLTGGDLNALYRNMGSILMAANQDPRLTQVFSLFNVDTPQVFVDIDRDKAMALGVPISSIFSTVGTVFGSTYVNDFNLYGRTWQVNVAGQMFDRTKPEDILEVKVKNSTGGMVPLSAFARIRMVKVPQVITRYNNYRSISINGSASAGTSTGTALQAMDELSAKLLPAGYSYEWTGSALEEKASGNTVLMIFTLSIVFAYLFLVALYESWSLPVVIVLTSCGGLVGALLGVRAMGLANDVYVQIGMVTLIALASKNAILIVEFAKELRDKNGMGIRQAAALAGKTRFRAIMMTAISTLVGALPLLTAKGAGAASRHSVGAAMVYGFAFATAVGVFIIPMLYVVLETVRTKFHEGGGLEVYLNRQARKASRAKLAEIEANERHNEDEG
ncbi:transporter [Alphaproteobacteria bacterium]|nr:transporter [Alphaproteobacteria bacterium]